MRPLPKRRPSRSAKWALRIAVFLPILLIMSVLAHRNAFIDTPSFLVLLIFTAAITLFCLIFVYFAFRSLWVKGRRGGRRAAWAGFICAVVLGPYIYGAALWMTNPQVIDVSTDLTDPPIFRAELREHGTAARAVVVGALIDSNPDLMGRRYNGAPETVLDMVLQLADERGWTVANRRGRVGADDEIYLGFAVESLILSMPTQVLVRITDEGDSAYFDMRSRSVFGPHDLGANADQITSFIDDLDFALIGQLER